MLVSRSIWTSRRFRRAPVGTSRQAGTRADHRPDRKQIRHTNPRRRCVAAFKHTIASAMVRAANYWRVYIADARQKHKTLRSSRYPRHGKVKIACYGRTLCTSAVWDWKQTIRNPCGGHDSSFCVPWKKGSLRGKRLLCAFFFFNKTAVRSIKKQLASYTVPGIGQSTEKTSRYASNVAMARKIETIVSKPLKRKRTSLHRVLTIENSRNRLKTLCDRWI